MNKVEHQNKHFQSISEEYYAARQNKNHLLFKKLLFKYVLHDLCVDSQKKICVLEPMCGYGEGRKIISKFVTKNIDYEGFDYSDSLIQKVKDENPQINIYKQDVTTFSTDKKYDIIILLGGLHHVPDYAAKVCKNMSNALKPGGFFINFEPTNNNFVVAMVRNIIYKKNHLFDELTEHDFSLKELNDFYEKAGLRLYRQYYPGLLAYVLYYNPDAFPGLNIGGSQMVNRLFKLERRLYNNWFGRIFSFCTFSILQK